MNHIKLRELVTGRFTWALLLALALLLVAWAFRDFSLSALWSVLLDIKVANFLVWILANVSVLLMMNGRWWLVLRNLDVRISVWTLMKYRLAGFSVSYFSPGPQFGGEPVQIMALTKRHDVPTGPAAASVAIDKMVELMVSSTFLICAVVTIALGPLSVSLDSPWQIAWLPLLILPLVLPATYFLLLRAGYQPVTALSSRFPPIASMAPGFERAMAKSLKDTRAAAGIVGVSVLALAALLVEFGLMVRMVNGPRGFWATLILFTVARITLLSPTPGGLGAVEAGQVLAFTVLHADSAPALAAILLIRGRDLMLGLLGFRFAGTIVKAFAKGSDRQHSVDQDKRRSACPSET